MKSELIIPEPATPPRVVPNRSFGLQRSAASFQTSPWVLWGFRKYVERYVARHFNSVRLTRHNLPFPVDGTPVIVYLNHASWWDPLICLLLQDRVFPGRAAFAPMDAESLNRYPILRKMGIFPVEQRSPRGARQFLRHAAAILATPDSMLWITPQGTFADARTRPVSFKPGLGHLAARARSAVFLPLAIEYVFWTERLPEVLAHFGNPVAIDNSSSTANPPQSWQSLFEQQLAATQDQLAKVSLARNTSAFHLIRQGRTGLNGVYRGWSHLKNLLQGKRFNPAHQL